jgi:Raf kinase inhibitor-like YbhB/YbcL family protein
MKRVTLAGLMLAALGGAHADDFKLESPDIGPDKPFAQEFVYNSFGCSGGNKSFALNWSGAPQGTQSYVIAHFDPDGARGRGFWHWFLIDIPASTTSLARDAGNEDSSKIPEGSRQLKNSFGRAGYGGSCPPTSDNPHTYVVTVYAVKVPKLDIPADTGAAQALPIVQANALGKATLTYQYGR